MSEPKPHERPTDLASIRKTLDERTGRTIIDPNSRSNNDYVRDVAFLLSLLETYAAISPPQQSEPTEPLTLDEALTQYADAGDRYRNVAIDEIEQKVKARYPEARTVRATAIVSDSYSEHDLDVLDATGTKLNNVTGDDWPFDDPNDPDFDDQWVITATEGACVFDDTVTIPLEPPTFDDSTRGL